MSKSATGEADRRRTPRFVCGGHAQLDCLPSSGLALRGRLRDLSLGGCCLDTTLPVDFGARAEVLVRVNAASFRALGEIRAVRDRSLAGVEFVQLSSRGREMLADVLADLARRNAAINTLRAERHDQDEEALARQLETARLGMLSFGRWLPVPQENVGGEESGNNQHVEASIIAPGPLIVTVDLFG